jgi:putative aldouronate transport system substrate-binding protein
VFNNENVLNEITACNNVIDKYENGLITGCLNPETAIPKMNEELKAAGIDTILTEKQTQLNVWLAGK